jgi:hypothetical protein
MEVLFIHRWIKIYHTHSKIGWMVKEIAENKVYHYGQRLIMRNKDLNAKDRNSL